MSKKNKHPFPFDPIDRTDSEAFKIRAKAINELRSRGEIIESVFGSIRYAEFPKFESQNENHKNPINSTIDEASWNKYSSYLYQRMQLELAHREQLFRLYQDTGLLPLPLQEFRNQIRQVLYDTMQEQIDEYMISIFPTAPAVKRNYPVDQFRI